MDDMDRIEALIVKSGRPLNKYFVNDLKDKNKSCWCIRLESDCAQRELVLTFDSYGRLDKIL